MLRSQSQPCICPSSNIITKFPDGDLHLEPDGENLWHPLQPPAAVWTHLAQALPSFPRLYHSGPFALTCTAPSLGQHDTAQVRLHFTSGVMHQTTVTQGMEPPVVILLGETAMRKQTNCEHSLETPEEFQTYKHITCKTCFISLLDEARSQCISGLSNKTVNGLISSFMLTTGPCFPRDSQYHYIWKSHRWVGLRAVRNTGPLSKRDGPTALRSHPKEVLPQAIAPHCMLCSVHADIRFCTLITLSGNSYWASRLSLTEKLPRLKKSCFKPKNVQAYQDQIFRAKINVKWKHTLLCEQH